MFNEYLDIPPQHLGWVQSLYLTDPQDDLAGIRRSKGDRVEGRNKWVLVQEAYIASLVGKGPSLLQLVSDPGIRKTMISSFLVDELERTTQKTPNMTLEYYFCDNEDERRKTAIAIVRGLLLQLLRQRPVLLSHLRIEYNEKKDEVFTNFDTLWRVLLNILKDVRPGEIYFLIDALDECEEISQEAFLVSLKKLAKAFQGSFFTDIKILITCRPKSEIEDILTLDDGTLRIDSATVNADLPKFFEAKINRLADMKKNWPDKLVQKIKETLQKKIGCTFLWASLVIDDIFKVKIASIVRKKFKELPTSLCAIHNVILGDIGEDYIQHSILLHRWVVVTRRHLAVSELAMVGFLADPDKDHQNYPSQAIQAEYAKNFKCCDSLLYRDKKTDTINLVYQSAKDYLVSQNHLGQHPSLSQI